jgi:hypothetical protein
VKGKGGVDMVEEISTEISRDRMKLKRGDETFTIEKEFFAAIIEAMKEIADLRECEVRQIVLKSDLRKAPTPIGSREWFRRLLSW